MIRQTRRGSREKDIDALATAIGERATKLHDSASLDPLMERIGDARYVLIGEASHGTSDFYRWRAELSKRLIVEKGFSFVGVEGDWPDCYRVNRHVKGLPDSGTNAYEVLHAFDRWPTWMWANREVVEFITWLRAHNERLLSERRVGFYGLDVYSLWESMAEVVRYLERIDPEAAREARQAYRCFEPYAEDVQQYARATALVPTSCEDEAVAILSALRRKAPEYAADGREDYFNAEQNAFVARGAELYYRTMVRGGPTSWNVRDHHMVDTLDRLMRHHGALGKAIMWAHNTHVGDARFTDMARAGMVNVGQLVRQTHEQDGVVLVGFGTHRGTVIAADEWGLPMQRMRVPDARADSYEGPMHQSGPRNFLLIFDGTDDGGIPGLDEIRGHRAIGVVYNPAIEHWGNYVPTLLARRYDAFLFFDETEALDPLHMPVHMGAEAPETYPSGQ
jgi:erythromycin esterase-like protein